MPSWERGWLRVDAVLSSPVRESLQLQTPELRAAAQVTVV